jgi:putative membrane protein
LYSCIGLGWLKIPWVPISLIGIAVSFYVGFKNKAAYDRTWEARKIWGGIVNSSRSWGIMVNGFVTDEFLKQDVLNFEIEEVRRRLIYRQIAWLYRLKRQLRILKPWEHNKYVNRRYREYINELFPNQDESIEIERFLINDDVERILKSANGCSQILYCQSEDLKKIKQLGLVDSFRHVEMQKMLTEFFTLQGKCERIKNFPLPRQYASSSVYFVYIFILLLPMGLLSVFSNTNLNEYMIWGVVPFTTLVGWVFWMMERVGDYAENPFENLAFDIPMTSLVRTIEIDLREMLNEMDIPKPILSKDDFIV